MLQSGNNLTAAQHNEDHNKNNSHFHINWQTKSWNLCWKKLGDGP